MNKLPKHLGGHGNFTHLDEGVLDTMIVKYGVKSMLDIGCGPGGMVELAISKGLDALGIDGDFTLKRDCPFIAHDYLQGPIKLDQEYDLGWSTEFVEHVEEEAIPNYMDTFTKCKRVVITFSKNKRPRLHVNAKPLKYWKKVFAKYGFAYNKNISYMLRKHSTMQREFFNNTGSYFFNTKYVDQ